jgi:hypothetical protein
MAVTYRALARIAGGFLFVSFMTLSAPLALADEATRSEQIPNGLLCTDEMLMDPFHDELEPTETADHGDAPVIEQAAPDSGGVCNIGAPVAI